jgi:hypothetical protein
MGKPHKELTEEFIERANPPLRVRNLFSKMPHYVSHSEGAIVLNAWDKNKNLAAFYVVDLAAKDSSAYVIGCYSKRNYVQGHPIFCAMKWGGMPTRRYEMCELVLKKPSIMDAIRWVR